MLASTWTLTGSETGLLYTALGVFAGASIVGLRVVAGKRQGRPLRPMLWVGTVALTGLLLAIAIRQGRFPGMRRFEALVLASWILAIGSLGIDRRLQRRIMLAAAAPMLALLCLFATLLVYRDHNGEGATVEAGQMVHIALAVMGLAAFAVAASVGVLYLRQIRAMKCDPTAAVALKMPPLERLDRLNFVAAAIGFPLLGLSVVAGWLFFASGDRETAWLLDPTVLATLSGLLVYVMLFAARAFLGWRGRRIAWMTVIGFLVFVVGLVVAAYCTSPNTLHGT